jgi:hypothetical protein
MNYYWISYIISTSAIIPLFFALIKIGKTNVNDNYFLFFVIFSSVSELLGQNLILFKMIKLATLVGNINILIFQVLFSFIFYKWGTIQSKASIYLLNTGFICLWYFENLFLSNLFITNSLSRVFLALFIVYNSVHLIGQQHLKINKSLWNSPMLLIPITFTICYSYKALLETLFIFKLPFNNSILIIAFSIMTYWNLLANINYTKSILCMDSQKRLTLFI